MSNWFKTLQYHNALKLDWFLQPKLATTPFTKMPATKNLVAAVVTLAVFTTAVVPQSATSQTEFDIQADSADLKSEFQKELDKWMLRAYEGDRDAQFKVGVLFANDQFGPPDHEQSAYWYRQAARQGHPLAQYNLGHQFLMGNGVKRDEEAAMQWWLKAAEQQHALAQFNIGRAYYLGIGLKKDLNQARFWFERASQNNEPKSTELLKQLGWWSPELDVQDTAEQVAVINTQSGKQENQGSDSNGFTSKIEPIRDPANSQTGSNQAIVISPDTKNQTRTVVSTDDESKPNNIDEKNGVDKSSSAKVNDSAEPNANRTIAVFTNPAVRSVLITILDDAAQLTTLDKGERWTTITSPKGFPVWVSRNFIRTNGNDGVITATSVNARSVPLITQGSVVGRFNQGEKVRILDSRNDWYRVNSPERFKGWVKTEELEQITKILTDNAPASAQTEQLLPKTKARVTEPATSSELAKPDNSSVTQTSEKTEPTTTDSDLKNDSLVTPETLNGTLGTGQSIDDNQWLFSQNQDHYTLQLASFNDITSVNQFLNSLSFKDSDNLRLYNSISGDEVRWTYITYGTYLNKDRAKKESQRLGQRRAWIRRLGILQEKRCLAWKKQVPAPSELNQFCI